VRCGDYLIGKNMIDNLEKTTKKALKNNFVYFLGVLDLIFTIILSFLYIFIVYQSLSTGIFIYLLAFSILYLIKFFIKRKFKKEVIKIAKE
jgi:hypothetical protein